MKLDTHVHTEYSGRSTLRPLTHLLRESYNSVDAVYRLAKLRGMDLVTITDHDVIEGALTIAHRPDVIVGCEVTAVFPDGVRVHLGVLGVSEAQHADIQRLRTDVRELLPYLNHVASRINGAITAPHIAALLPWVDGLEVRNGSRLPSQNRTAAAIAEAQGKSRLGGSDSHTQRGVGRTWVEIAGVSTREEFMEGLRAGKGAVGGGEGHYFTMASDICRIAASFYSERLRMTVQRPGDWRRHAVLAAAILGLPLVCVPLAVALGHFVLEDRFNRDLLVDLVARPSRRVPQLREVA